MASVNKVIIVGNLGADPTVRQTQNGGVITTISVATSQRWTDKQTGEQKEQTEWHAITFFNRLAEVARDYLHKGSSVYVEGQLKTEKYTDQQGIERYATKIHAQTLQMLGSPQNSGQQGGQSSYNGGYPQQGYPQPSSPPQAPQGYPQNPPQGMGSSLYQTMGSEAPSQVSDDDMPF